MFALLYGVVRYLIQCGSVPGFPFLAAAIAIFSGAQLFALGIIGEYLARMHFRLMDRPAYTVRATTGQLQSETLPLVWALDGPPNSNGRTITNRDLSSSAYRLNTKPGGETDG